MMKTFKTSRSLPGTLCIAMALLFIIFPGCERDDELVAIVSFEIINPVPTSGGIFTGGRLMANREISVDQFGIVYSTSPQPDMNNFTAPGQNLETSWVQDSYSVEFTSLVTGLSSGTTYYGRAFITTRTGTAYSTNQIEFTAD